MERMSAFTQPRHPLVEQAVRIGSHWCAGRRIDGGVAFGHGCRVALMVDRYWPDAPPSWYATALVHDLPEFIVTDTGEPDRSRVEAAIVPHLGEEVLGYVWGLWDEHEVYEVCDRTPEIADTRVPELGERCLPLLSLMAADQVVSFTNVQRRLTRAVNAGSSAADFWGVRGNLLDRMPYFRRFHAAAKPFVPAALSDHWGQCLALIPTNDMDDPGAVCVPGPSASTDQKETRQ